MSSNATEPLTKKEREMEQLKSHRMKQFVKLLGPAWNIDDIMALVDSSASHHDLESLLQNGCPKHLAVKILL